MASFLLAPPDANWHTPCFQLWVIRCPPARAGPAPPACAIGRVAGPDCTVVGEIALERRSSAARSGAQFHYYTLRGPLYAGPSMTRTVRVGDNTSPHLLPRHASECPGNRVGRCCSPPVPPVQRASCMNQNELPGLGTPATTPLYATRI